MSETTTNNEQAAAIDPLDRLGLHTGPQPDRLPPMLFLAALIHGILIIGITFNAVLRDEFSDSISLEVTIVADPEKQIEAPDEAQYLAQASQSGAGNTRESARPSAMTESDAPIDNAGVDDGNELRDAASLEDPADQVLTSRAELQLEVSDRPRDLPQPDETRAIALESGVEVTLPLPRDDEANPLIHDDDPRQLVTSVDTRESNIAGYLDRWKTKIETIGVRYFPEKGITQGFTGSPVLEVTISASGDLEAVVIRQTSGSKILDQAALNILRRAAPFDPFPEAIRLDYDELRFAYKWQFREIGTSATASASAN